MKKIAVLQSNYIPWRGYFDMIASVDEFIIYDEVQYTRQDWRNRNKIKTPSGIAWISIPVGTDINRSIREVLLPSGIWYNKHLTMLEHNYCKAKYFKEIMPIIRSVYIKNHKFLSELNCDFIKIICAYLNIRTKISYSWDYVLEGCKNERLVNLCIQSGATEYVSGPAAQSYIDESLFQKSRIQLTWFDYHNFPSYPQLWGEFEPYVTILDLLFNCGIDSTSYMSRHDLPSNSNFSE